MFAAAWRSMRCCAEVEALAVVRHRGAARTKRHRNANLTALSLVLAARLSWSGIGEAP